MTKFLPLTLELIEEGQFVEDFESELAHAQRALIAFVKRHGGSAKGAKAEVNVKITIGAGDIESQVYSITSAIKTTIPRRLTGLSSAIQDFCDDGTETLFVRETGSDDGDPRQGKLFGRPDSSDAHHADDLDGK